MSHYDFFSSKYQGTAPAVLYYTCPWTVTPAAKNQLEAKFTIEIEVLGLVSSFFLLSYPIPRSSSVDMPSPNPISDPRTPYPYIKAEIPRFNCSYAYQTNNATWQTARLNYEHDKHFFKIDCLPAEKAMVYTMFSRVIDAFLKEQVGLTVEVSSP